VKPARGRPGAPVVGGRACLASSAEIAPAARTMTSARYASGPTLQEMTQPAMTPLTLTLRQGDVRRSLERGDVESIMRHARHTDMEQTYWLPGRPAVTAAAAEALVQEPTLGWDGSGPHGAALFIRRRDELVGVVSLRIESTRLELGYGVAPRFAIRVWRPLQPGSLLIGLSVPLSGEGSSSAPTRRIGRRAESPRSSDASPFASTPDQLRPKGST
jgi:hypothetical protein